MKRIFGLVESPETDVRANLAVDEAHFRSIVIQLGAYKQLRAAILNVPTAARAVARRVRVLAGQRCDPGYAHPGDTALGMYLMALEGHYQELARASARDVLHASECWWGRRIAQGIADGTVRWDVLGRISKVDVRVGASEESIPAIQLEVVDEGPTRRMARAGAGTSSSGRWEFSSQTALAENPTSAANGADEVQSGSWTPLRIS